MSIITYDRLAECLSYNPKTGIFVWRRTGPGVTQGMVAGAVNKFGYVKVKIDGRTYGAHRLAWLYTYGVMPDQRIDHRNLTKSDNRIENLRLATAEGNARNKTVPSNNKTGVKGVSFYQKLDKYVAKIGYKGVQYHLGYFESKGDAARAYMAKARELHGEFFRM